MNQQEIIELSQKAREDGARLFTVCESIYKTLMLCMWGTAIIGGIAAISAMSVHFLLGVGVGLFVAALCFIQYVIAVLVTHTAKVLVHTSFATVGVLEQVSQKNI